MALLYNDRFYRTIVLCVWKRIMLFLMQEAMKEPEPLRSEHFPGISLYPGEGQEHLRKRGALLHNQVAFLPVWLELRFKGA